MYNKKQQRVRLFSIIATVLMIFSLFAPTLSAQTLSVGKSDKSGQLHESAIDPAKRVEEKISNRLMDEYKDSDLVTFLVKFEEKADTTKVAEEARKAAESAQLSSHKATLNQRSTVISELKSVSLESQANVKQFLEEQVENDNVDSFHSYHIVNGMAVTAPKKIAEKLASFPEVEKILPNEERELHVTFDDKVDSPKASLQDDEEIEWNVDRVNAPDAWAMGVDGSGTVVASLDTGVQWDHPALKEQYRGYDSETGDVDHEYSFYDATSDGHETPVDDNGHGTHVTGTMVGHEEDGSNQIGVAPGAKWIAAKVFDAAGNAKDADLLDAAEWILAPGGRADLAPDVVNNSWDGGPGLDEWYRDTVIAWRDANIFPEFAAGNTDLFNPGGPGSVAAPSNYPESFAVGATDSNDVVADFSLRGPSPYDEIKPDIAAPGVGIRSAIPGDSYGSNNGTSMASPAVSGIAALLRQVNADISVDDMEEILLSTAIPKTDDEYPESPNNGYGHGLIDASAAVTSIMDGIGSIEGYVTKDGEDNEAPTFEHEAPAESYSGMGLDLKIQASDNVSVTSVELNYQVDGGEMKTVEADRVSGDFKDGEYKASIDGEDLVGELLEYHWVINDFGNNEVISDDYSVELKSGISTGYSEDFEAEPAGWTSYGDENSWEWGEPTSGPGSALTGDNVYATNLSGQYDSNMNASLEMPPIDLPEGDAYLQFTHWHEFEQYDSGTSYDFGHLVVSTDQEEWTQLETFEGLTSDWTDTEIDLSDYSGERIYIAFNATSDISVNKEGWYIDSVALSEESNQSSASLNVTSETLSTDKALKEDKPDVDPTKQKPVVPHQEKLVNDQAEIQAGLPLGATVSVLETGSSTKTDPADGSYSLMSAAGTFTVEAETYGYESVEQEVEVEADQAVEANFTLDELDQATVTGTITNEATGDPIEGATLLLVEDANVEPVETDADGDYSLTAYEGTYTLKVMAKDYHGTEVEVDMNEDINLDIELEPFYTVPGGEIGYDDGVADNARAFYDAGNGWGVKMSLPEGKEKAIVTDGVFKFWNPEFPTPGGTDFQVEVWDASGVDGLPGEKLAGPIDAEAIRDETDWTVVDLSEHNIEVDGDFYMVYVQTAANTGAPGLATDETSPNAGRSHQLVGGSWEPSPADEGNYMIRARVSYEVETPVISSPAEDFITNESDITIEGTASPTTTIELLSDGEAVDSVEVGDDGEFSFDQELSEGENEFVAVSKIDGAKTGESDPVMVTLDTEAPEVTIDNPVDGDKSNRETVTVEGNVQDENFDYVEVNGQKADVNDEGDFSKRILLDNGENVIEIVAADLAGNTTTETVTLDVKYDAPEIDNLTPTEDQHVDSGESVMIEFDSEPGARATFVVHMPLTNTGIHQNATELPMMEMEDGRYVGYWTAPANAYAEGAVIEVIVKDAYGNETREQADGKLFINVED